MNISFTYQSGCVAASVQECVSSGSRKICQPTCGTDPAETQEILEENPHTSRRPISMATLGPLRLDESELLVGSEWALEFVRAHDQEVWECLFLTVLTGPESVAGHPLAMGGLGLRSVERTKWPVQLGQLGRHTEDQGEAPRSGGFHRVPLGAISPCLGSVWAATTLDGVDGFEVPSWCAVTAGQRPPIMEVQGTWCLLGGQHAAASGSSPASEPKF